jgi:hypothetical protein
MCYAVGGMAQQNSEDGRILVYLRSIIIHTEWALPVEEVKKRADLWIREELPLADGFYGHAVVFTRKYIEMERQ